MAARRVGTVRDTRHLSSRLVVFRLFPEPGRLFPSYQAGTHIALSRDDCRLTKPAGVDSDGRPIFVPDLDDAGRPKVGTVTHSYSIASAPFETLERQYLEFYVARTLDEHGLPGRLSEMLFGLNPATGCEVMYFDRIVGTFTLVERAQGFDNIVMIGSGTGVAPFVSMLKQLQFEALHGRPDGRRFTLLHTNRVPQELGYHEELLAIEAAGSVALLYVPTVSRPGEQAIVDGRVGHGRATNVFRHVFGLPTREEQMLEEANAADCVAVARASAGGAVPPMLPVHIHASGLRSRVQAPRTVLLACGNPAMTADVRRVAGPLGIPCETEEW